MNSRQTQSYQLGLLIKPIATTLIVGAIFIVMLLAITIGGSLAGATVTQKVQALFGLDSVQLWWYITRASGLTGYFLLWLSMVWGFAIPTKIVQPVLEGTFTYDFHEYLSLLGLGFVLLHIVVLLFDQFLPFSIIQLLIPFTDSYRPLWVGIGIISFYVLLVVTITFYLRGQIGVKTFRSIHVLSLVGYLGATLHGLFAGTDSALPVTTLLYAGTFLVVVFLTVYWLYLRTVGKDEERPTVARSMNRNQYQRR